ncbi:MAG: Glutamine amidotransferase class-I [Pseudomonadota bacterium]|jgi:GMP synthase-like glutamine amidotransferase
MEEWKFSFSQEFVPVKRRKHDLLIIDPAAHEPETAAYNRISMLFGELAEHHDFSMRAIIIKCPALSGDDPLENAFHDHDYAGVIGLGSTANVTENPSWLPHMRQLLTHHILDKNIPFLGICFSHQMLGDMHKAKVDYIDNRHLLPTRRYQTPRGKKVVSPKMALLTATLQDTDYFSHNRKDLSFAEAVRQTHHWTEKDWKNAFSGDDSKHPLLPTHERIRKTIRSLWPKDFWSHTWHEQEVKAPNVEWDLHVAMTSPECHIDALVHPEKPIYSVQSHPETPHPTRDGDRLLKNFIYMCHLLRQKHS